LVRRHEICPRVAPLRGDHPEAVLLDPRYFAALVGVATNYLYLGDPSRAEDYARRALEADSQDPRGPITLAEVLLRQRRFAEAQGIVRRGLPLEPGRLHGESLI
jgi:Tfp pilus assembly protein PilF